MHLRRAIPMLAVLCLASVCCVTVLGEPAYYAGVDISMLPEIEKAGGKFSDQDKPGDAIEILRRHGCNLFRVRLFVQPSTDFNKSYGATQDLPYVIALAKRIAAAHAMFMLDIHYSDTWADGGKQFKPASWKELGLDQLEKRVYDYTADVLKQLQDAGGEVIESVPGRIRVRLGARGSVYAARGRASWLILGRKSSLIEVELQLERSDPARDNLLHITVLMRPVDRRAGEDEEWRERCDKEFYSAMKASCAST
jgi:arabinogalactan endo-1,4-beta-galactosidase